MLFLTPQRTEISISGPLTVRTCEGYTCDVLSHLEHATAAALDISGCHDVDIAGIQVVEAARRHAARRGVAFELTAPADGRWLEVLELGGFLQAAGPGDRAFWLHEAAAS